MQIIKYPSQSDWTSLITRPVKDIFEIEKKVAPILENVKNKGDEALREYALAFDNIILNDIEMPLSAIESAESKLSDELKNAIKLAYANIYQFHKGQLTAPEKIETMPGVVCWRKSVGIEKVGLYIPGGTAPLFSTVLMLGIPAQIAGCKRVVLCTPSDHPAILFAASLCGITEIYRIGGAQAIGALAYGTDSIPKVYKIFGPGNQYVTAAKILVNKEGTAIDMPAGPSEVAVLVDQTAVPAFVASDLLSQAEHGVDSQVLLVGTELSVIEAVIKEVALQTEDLPRKEIVKKAIENSRFILVNDLVEAIDLLNEYAAEHLILACQNAVEIESQIFNAGSIFLGNYTPEAAGDYASGTNHTLPTNGFAMAYSGVSVDSFVKKITVQHISEQGLQNVGPIVELMAEAESLIAHKNAVTIRLNAILK
ncbi:MAG: histidinol dehydrogenase [Bacteroidota bacterium]